MLRMSKFRNEALWAEHALKPTAPITLFSLCAQRPFLIDYKEYLAECPSLPLMKELFQLIGCLQHKCNPHTAAAAEQN